MISAIKKKLTKKKEVAEKKPVAKKVVKKEKAKEVSSRKNITNQEILETIAKVAYEYFEKRGNSHGGDQDDWYKAEKIVKAKYKIKG